MQLRADSIVNADVNSAAAIAQSKLNLNAATTRANATGISQNDLGVASFDNSIFTSTNGFITIDNGQLDYRKLINIACLLYTSPSPRDKRQSRMPSSA